MGAELKMDEGQPKEESSSDEGRPKEDKSPSDGSSGSASSTKHIVTTGIEHPGKNGK